MFLPISQMANECSFYQSLNRLALCFVFLLVREGNLAVICNFTSIWFVAGPNFARCLQYSNSDGLQHLCSLCCLTLQSRFGSPPNSIDKCRNFTFIAKDTSFKLNRKKNICQLWLGGNIPLIHRVRCENNLLQLASAKWPAMAAT